MVPAILAPLIAPILSLAIQHAPALIGVIAGDNAGQIAERVVSTAKEVLGTADPVEAKEKLDADPSLAEAFTARLNADVETLRAELADQANARAMGLGLVQARHWSANMPAILVLLAVFGFFFFLAVLFAIPMEIPDRLFQLLYIGFGTLQAAFISAMQYYLGTTRSSAQKDDQTAALASALQSQTSNVVPLRRVA